MINVPGSETNLNNQAFAILIFITYLSNSSNWFHNWNCKNDLLWNMLNFFFYRLVGLKVKKIEILWIREIPNSNLSKRKKRKIIVGVKVKWKTFFKIIKGRYSSFVYFERDCFYIVFIKTFHYSFPLSFLYFE